MPIEHRAGLSRQGRNTRPYSSWSWPAAGPPSDRRRPLVRPCDKYVDPVVTVAVVAALLGAFFFGLAAALQQTEARRATDLRTADPRLLWRLAHRPLWVAGIAADGISAVLHVLALSFGPITLVQPLGITGLLFAMPIVAVLRRQRISARDLSAAVVVLAALSLLLALLPTAGSATLGTSLDLAGLIVAMLVFDAAAVAVAALTPPRIRSLALATGAGASFGIAAVLVRALLEMREQPHSTASVAVSVVGIGLLIPVGYLLLQNAYRSGHFSARPGHRRGRRPHRRGSRRRLGVERAAAARPWQILSSVACAGLVIAGITVLVRSPSHLLDPDESDPATLRRRGGPGRPQQRRRAPRRRGRRHRTRTRERESPDRPGSGRRRRRPCWVGTA